MASGVFYPAVSGDDGYWYSTTFNNAGFGLEFGHNGLDSLRNFIRFVNVGIPQGVVITEAFVRFTCRSTDSTTTINLNVYANDVDDSVAPTSASEGEALVLTSAVAWSNVGAWTDGVEYDTPSIISIIQSITDRGGWDSGNSLQILVKDNGSTSGKFRTASAIDFIAAEKAQLHVTWSLINFTFTSPIPAHLSTVYGTTEQLRLTTTISGNESNYIYAASFYDGLGVQIGTTISGINSGVQVSSNVPLSTPSGIDYSWYVTTTSSGSEDTSQVYTFSNKFLYEGYVTENSTPVNRQVRLYYRDTGELIDDTTSSGVGGYFRLETTYNESHYAVCLDDEGGVDYNDLIYGNVYPISG